jgi:hypothetical protein
MKTVYEVLKSVNWRNFSSETLLWMNLVGAAKHNFGFRKFMIPNTNFLDGVDWAYHHHFMKSRISL